MFPKFSQTEKEKLFLGVDRATMPTWTNCSSFGMEIQPNVLKSPPQQLPNYFFNPNWENSPGQSDPFEPYIGGNNSSNTSIYSTPLSSPPKLNLLSITDHQIRAPFSADPGRFTCFAGGSLGGQNGNFGLRESEFPPILTPRMESNKSIEVVRSALGVEENKDGFFQDGNSGSDKKFSTSSSTPENGEIGDSRDESSVSEQIPGREIGMKCQSNANAKKRKSIGRGKLVPKAAAEKELESNSKRSKSDEATANENRRQTKDSEKPSEPPKDYIHVRARRGQATDSHSLAERVRREKIGERMKFLQDLVPGCNKVTGKAVMLDEIINYVQSLQRQVEFLSMKLATVNPGMEFSMETLLSKNTFQSRGSMPHNIYPLGSTTSSAFPYGYQSPQDPSLQSGIPNGEKTPFLGPSIEGFGEGAFQGLTLWEGDLQSVVQMGFGQQNFSWHSTDEMKSELMK